MLRKHPAAPGIARPVDHVTAFLGAASPETSETVCQSRSRDGMVDSGSFPITLSLVRSSRLWIAMLQHDASL